MANIYRKLEAYLEENSDDAGPIDGTLSFGRIGMIWLAANLVVTTLLTGTLFVPGVSFGTAFTMILLGTLGGMIVLTLIGNIGTRTGLPTMAATRGAFGLRGSLLPVAANVTILMGWSWVQAMLAGVTVNFLIQDLTGFSNPILFSVLCQTLVVCLAIFGHEGIAKVEPWMALLIIAIMAYVFYVALSKYSIGDYQSIPTEAAIGLDGFTVLDIVIATAISWTVLSADFNRLARNSRVGITGSGLGYTLSTVLSMSLGLVAFCYVLLEGNTAAEFDPGTIVASFGAPLAIVIFLSVMATNTMVVYGMVTSVINARPNWKLKFLPTALVLGTVSILGSTLLGLLDHFTDFLTMIGAFFVPVFAIMIVDYYLIKRTAYMTDILRERDGKYWYTQGINWYAVVVWVIGAAASYLLTYVWQSPIGATIPAFVVSFVLYFILSIGTRGRFNGDERAHLNLQSSARR
jgi:NCS1 family nucleobase:cation symporter-1